MRKRTSLWVVLLAACNGGPDRAANDIPCDDGQEACGEGQAARCVNVATDSANCGACGRVCSPRQPFCADGNCVEACPAGKTACGTSCVDPASDTMHCGACGKTCNLPNATSKCVSSACAVLTCVGGWGDCNNDPKDGCERDLTVSAHCGACGNACKMGELCTGGKCLAPPRCGDGIVNGVEQCDNGAENTCSGTAPCAPNCTRPSGVGKGKNSATSNNGSANCSGCAGLTCDLKDPPRAPPVCPAGMMLCGTPVATCENMCRIVDQTSTECGGPMYGDDTLFEQPCYTP